MTNKIELVYDRLIAQEKLKNGTKYERLAAIVFSILEEQETVHDLRLVGAVGVPHQIDAVVGDDRKRILVEAKDYHRNVTLEVVRDFSAVVRDLKPDEAFVVTTEGFSDNAVKWAKAHGIKLAILRPPQEDDDDWGDLLRAVHHTMYFSSANHPTIEWRVPPEEGPRFAGGRNPLGMRRVDDLRIGTLDAPTAIRPFIEPLLRRETAKIPAGEPGIAEGAYEFDEPTWLHVAGEDPIRVEGFKWTQEVVVARHDFSVGFGFGDLTAELMLRTVDGDLHRIFSNRQIEAVYFDGKTARPG